MTSPHPRPQHPAGSGSTSPDLPLQGKRVAITRAREQAAGLRTSLEALGADVLELPLISISADVDAATRADVFAELGSYEWLVFTSTNGVRFFFEELLREFTDIRALGMTRIAAIGGATARAVKAYHLRVDLKPERATGAELASALAAQGSLDNARILVVTGSRNRDALVRTLEENRAIVDSFPVYRTDLVDMATDPAAEEWRAHGVDAVLFASSSAVESFANQAAHLQVPAGRPAPLAGSIGPQTSAAMRARGIPVDFEASGASNEALVAALAARLQRKDP